MRHGWRRWASLMLAAAVSLPAMAEDRRVVLVGAGEEVAIGTLHLSADGEGAWRFRLELDEARFEERFLAMRPFKCLLGERQDWCHFPYGTDDRITRDDLQPLEYALMFLHKRPPDVNVNSRNGLYFRLGWDGPRLVGVLHDVDMEPIIVPDGHDPRRPIGHGELYPTDPGSYRFSGIRIE